MAIFFHAKSLFPSTAAAMFQLMMAGSELLSVASCDPNTTNRRSRVAALHLAVTQGNPDMVRLLLKSGASVNIKKEDGGSALHIRFRIAVNDATGLGF